MNLDEAICHAEEVAEENYGKAIEYLNDREIYKHEEQKCVKCADEHMQLAEWLKDYKRLLKLEQELKTGRWVYDYTSADGHKCYHCSECGCFLKPKHSEPLNSFKWCRLCGARMIKPEPQESEK